MRRLALVGLVAVLALSGCSIAGTDEPTASASTTSTSTPTPTATAATALSCDAVLPVSRASAALGVAAADLTGGREENTLYTADLVRETASTNGGMIDCGWYEDEGPASIRVRIAQDAEAIFAATEPDVDDGRGLLAPVAIGDVGYARCADGEGDACRAEILTGDTWLSITRSSRPADDAEFTALVTAITADAQGRLEPATLDTAPDCATVLTDAQLSELAGLTTPLLGSVEETGTRGTIASATRERAGYLSCSWTSGDGSVWVSAAPHAADAWASMALSSNLFVALEPLDDVGNRAMAGCGAARCEVEALQDDTWWRIEVAGDATQAAAVARAVLAG
ncbi:hypothetical protein HQQ80_21010 [Microbacteriaceae bacterium VKM Ac-2855]|nr:hypothetical protein [Microbacteriaceae bacterium VKM Ac-2855]